MTDILLILIVLLALPFVVYTSVKLGTFAFYRGRQLFDERKSDGEKPRRTTEGISPTQGRDPRFGRR
jgi:hypothetical protein